MTRVHYYCKTRISPISGFSQSYYNNGCAQGTNNKALYILAFGWFKVITFLEVDLDLSGPKTHMWYIYDLKKANMVKTTLTKDVKIQLYAKTTLMW
jgi:hypothetical protein